MYRRDKLPKSRCLDEAKYLNQDVQTNKLLISICIEAKTKRNKIPVQEA